MMLEMFSYLLKKELSKNIRYKKLYFYEINHISSKTWYVVSE